MEMGELVRGVLVPTCVVIATPGAEAVCARNGRRVVEVLRSQNTTRTLAARGPNDRTYAVRDFQLRFADLQDFTRPSPPASTPASPSTPRGDAEENGGATAATPGGGGGLGDRESEARRLLASSADDAYAPPLSLKDPADVASFLRGMLHPLLTHPCCHPLHRWRRHETEHGAVVVACCCCCWWCDVQRARGRT
jgi:hypothetical protein